MLMSPQSMQPLAVHRPIYHRFTFSKRVSAPSADCHGQTSHIARSRGSSSRGLITAPRPSLPFTRTQSSVLCGSPATLSPVSGSKRGILHSFHSCKCQDRLTGDTRPSSTSSSGWVTTSLPEPDLQQRTAPSGGINGGGEDMTGASY